MCAKRSAGWLASGETVAQTQLGPRLEPQAASRDAARGGTWNCFVLTRQRRRATRAQLGWNDEGPPVVGYLGRFIEAKGSGS